MQRRIMEEQLATTTASTIAQGSAAQPAASTGGLFGQPAQAPSTGGLFGAPAPAAPAPGKKSSLRLCFGSHYLFFYLMHTFHALQFCRTTSFWSTDACSDGRGVIWSTCGRSGNGRLIWSNRHLLRLQGGYLDQQRRRLLQLVS